MENSSIWSGISMQTRIACMVCYAAIFKDVIRVSEMFEKLNVENKDAFDKAIKDLETGKFIVIKDGFAALPYLVEKILNKAADFNRSEQLIHSKIKFLKKLGKLPLIKFIGISGSVAAGNPVKDFENKLDIDIFVITGKQLIWFFCIPMIFARLFQRKNTANTMCFNYILDESDLMIYNRNLYTAHEIRNLIPISGMDTYNKFLQTNNWVNCYFPGFINNPTDLPNHVSNELVNKLMFLIYTGFRCIKKFTLKPLREISFKVDPVKHLNINRMSSLYGGYQALVQKNFTKIFNTSFPELKEDKLIEKLFGDELSIAIKKADYNIEEFYNQAGIQILYQNKYEQ